MSNLISPPRVLSFLPIRVSCSSISFTSLPPESPNSRFLIQSGGHYVRGSLSHNLTLTAIRIKMSSSSDNILGLTDKEIKMALCALKVMIIDGKVRVHIPAPCVMDAERHGVFSANTTIFPGREGPPCQTDWS